MPLLDDDVVPASAGAATKTFQKPTGEVKIIGINVSFIHTTFFAKTYAYLRNKDKTTQVITLFRVWPPLGGYGWKGVQNWPHNWELRIGSYTQQAASKVHFTVEYEIIEPKKKGWGA